MEKIEKERLVKFAKDQEVFYEKMGVKKAKKQESGLQILTPVSYTHLTLPTKA